MLSGVLNKTDSRIEARASFLSVYSTVLIVIAPIIRPYGIGNFSFFWLLGLVLLALFAFRGKKLYVMKNYHSLMIYVTCSLVISLNGLFLGYDIKSLGISLLAMVFDFLVYYVAWQSIDFKLLIRVSNIFGYICCFVLFLQAFHNSLSIPYFNGVIPFLNLNSHQGWVTTSYGFRFNSLFSEPSYFAIYMLPIFAINLLHNKWVNSFLFGFSIVLSSSSIGIILVALIFVYKFVFVDFIKNKRFLPVAIGLLLLATIFLVFASVPSLSDYWALSKNKLDNLGSASTNIRTFGYIGLFAELQPKEQVLGVGFGQLQNYFATRGVKVFNYSGSLVLTLLDFGIIGCFAFLFFAIDLLKHSLKKGSFIFFCILFLVFSVDSLLFNYRFYYLLFFVYSYPKIVEAIK